MFFAVGKVSSGSCEILDGECVRTRFIFIGPLLIPVDSFYVTSGATIPVRRNGWSVALAYLRWVVAPLAIFFAFIALNNDTMGRPGASHTATLFTLVALGCVWVALIGSAGRVRGRNARQRRILARFVGHAAPPEILLDEALALAIHELDQHWEKSAPAQTAYRVDANSKIKWRDLSPKDVPPLLLYLYYALCRYEAVRTGEEAMQKRARFAWRRVEAEI